jgi:Protein of unknown function (DUF3631)
MRNKNRSLDAVMTKVQPWDEPVDGKALLDEIERVLKGHVVLPKWGAETLALWCVHTYAFELRDVGTYIGIESPEKRCGKSTLLGVLRRLVNRPVMAANISSPAFFRVIEETQPTLLIDEADTFLEGNDELRGILNAGYSRETAYVIRVQNEKAKVQRLKSKIGNGVETQQRENPKFESGSSNAEESRLVSFSCWCPKAMAAIGRLPDTLADRCIVIRMQRKVAGEKCERPRKLETAELNRKCARFMMDNAEGIANGRPELPASLHDRAGDIWEPLLVLADLAGGDWPERARQAAVGLTTGAEENCPIGALLFDLFVVFNGRGAEKLFTREVLDGLSCFENRPWHSMRRGKEMTEAWLAQRLRPYGIKPQTIRVGDDVGRGYLAADFTESLKRYVPKPEREELLSELKWQAAKNEEKQKQMEAKQKEIEAERMRLEEKGKRQTAETLRLFEAWKSKAKS